MNSVKIFRHHSIRMFRFVRKVYIRNGWKGVDYNMNLRVGGIENISTIDWYGRVSTVVFCAGCNFKCQYCHNSPLILMCSGEEITPEYFEDRIKINRKFIDAIVFTGGEPILQPDAIIEFAKISKKFGLKVMLDTNGSVWENLSRILESGYVDRVALDIKAPLDTEHYKVFSTYTTRDIWSVETCLRVCKRLGIEMEVRTTVAPDVSDSPEFIRKIAESIKDKCDAYYLQQYSNEGDILDPVLKEKPSPTRDKMVELAKVALSTGLKNVFIKTRLDGLEKITLS